MKSAKILKTGKKIVFFYKLMYNINLNSQNNFKSAIHATQAFPVWIK